MAFQDRSSLLRALPDPMEMGVCPVPSVVFCTSRVRQWPQDHIPPPPLMLQPVKVVSNSSGRWPPDYLSGCFHIWKCKTVMTHSLQHLYWIQSSENAYLIDIFIVHLSSCPIFRSFCFCICLLNSKHFKDRIFFNLIFLLSFQPPKKAHTGFWPGEHLRT